MSQSTFMPSPYQAAIFEWMQNGTGNATANATAGSGKSTTMLEGMKLYAKTAVYLAFSRAMADEFNRRLEGTPFSANTFHATGRAILTRVRGKSAILEYNKYEDILFGMIAEPNTDDPMLRTALSKMKRLACDPGTTIPNKYKLKTICKRAAKLFDKCRVTMTPLDDSEAILRAHVEFNIDLDDSLVYEGLIRYVFIEMLRLGLILFDKIGKIDYTDMIYIPVLRGYTTAENTEWLFIDECQDLSEMTRRFAVEVVRANRKLAVGDPRQAIMAFAGASTDSYHQVRSALNAVEFPLSVCYRCPTSHLDYARKIVPTIQAREGAIQGEFITGVKEENLFQLVQKGDLVICRLTAPLISACIELIARGHAAKVKGREIGEELIGIVEKISKLPNFRWEIAIEIATEWEGHQVEKMTQRNLDEQAIETFMDKVDAVIACIENMNATSVDNLIEKIKNLFAEDDAAIWLSTIHRSKGLEADNVFILRPEKLPLTWDDQTDEALEQELNLVYVAFTRAKKKIVVLGDLPIVESHVARIANPELHELAASTTITPIVLDDSDNDALTIDEVSIPPIVADEALIDEPSAIVTPPEEPATPPKDETDYDPKPIFSRPSSSSAKAEPKSEAPTGTVERKTVKSPYGDRKTGKLAKHVDVTGDVHGQCIVAEHYTVTHIGTGLMIGEMVTDKGMAIDLAQRMNGIDFERWMGEHKRAPASSIIGEAKDRVKAWREDHKLDEITDVHPTPDDLRIVQQDRPIASTTRTELNKVLDALESNLGEGHIQAILETLSEILKEQTEVA